MSEASDPLMQFRGTLQNVRQQIESCRGESGVRAEPDLPDDGCGPFPLRYLLWHVMDWMGTFLPDLEEFLGKCTTRPTSGRPTTDGIDSALEWAFQVGYLFREMQIRHERFNQAMLSAAAKGKRTEAKAARALQLYREIDAHASSRRLKRLPIYREVAKRMNSEGFEHVS